MGQTRGMPDLLLPPVPGLRTGCGCRPRSWPNSSPMPPVRVARGEHRRLAGAVEPRPGADHGPGRCPASTGAGAAGATAGRHRADHQRCRAPLATPEPGGRPGAPREPASGGGDAGAGTPGDPTVGGVATAPTRCQTATGADQTPTSSTRPRRSGLTRGGPAGVVSRGAGARDQCLQGRGQHRILLLVQVLGLCRLIAARRFWNRPRIGRRSPA